MVEWLQAEARDYLENLGRTRFIKLLSVGVACGTILERRKDFVTAVEDILKAMKAAPTSVRFSDCLKVCRRYFGDPRTHGSHHVFKTPWQGDPRINIQDIKGYVKPYQVKQVLCAIKKLEDESNV